MNKIKDIEYKQQSYTKDLCNSRLELSIKGSNINYIILNTIRRVILSDIPIYAFTKFNFTTNESIFNNNYLKLRFTNLPVVGIENTIEKYNVVQNETVINEEVSEEEDLLDNENIDLGDESNKKVNTSSLGQLTMYVDIKSTEKMIKTVTTNDAKFYYNEKNIPSPYKVAIPLVKLQPDQSINFSAITSLGTEKINPIYSAVCVCYYKEIDEHDYTFIVESRGQLTEKRIIHVALINIIDTLKKIVDMIPVEQLSHTGKIIINNENNTMGNLLSYGMTSHKDVKIAGYNIPHLLEDKVIIHYELANEKIKLKNVLDDVLEYLLKLFNELIKLNNSIGKK